LEAARATCGGLLAQEIESVRVPPGFTPINHDNGICADTSIEKMQALVPAFVKPFGTVTAAVLRFCLAALWDSRLSTAACPTATP
jgi:acetyl-CoA acetyltransferase